MTNTHSPPRPTPQHQRGEQAGNAKLANPDPLASLILGVQAGEAAAARQLVQALSRPLMSHAFRYVQNWADAEDIVQDAFARLWPILPQWQFGTAKIETFARHMVGNMAIDSLRHRKRWAQDSALDDNLAADSADAEAQLLSNEVTTQQAQAIDAALAQLNERQRAAFVAFYMDGLTSARIAALMKLSLSAVESLLARARQLVREYVRLQGGADANLATRQTPKKTADNSAAMLGRGGDICLSQFGSVMP